MNDRNVLNLLCVFDGECPSKGVFVKLGSSCPVNRVGLIIKHNYPDALVNLRVDQLTFWHVSIKDQTDIQHLKIVLDAINGKNILPHHTKLSTLFLKGAPKNTVHLIIERPTISGLVGIDRLCRKNDRSLVNTPGILKEASTDIRDKAITLEVHAIVGESEEHVEFNWCTTMKTATLAGLKNQLCHSYEYVYNDTRMEVAVPTGRSYEPETVPNDESLRTVLRRAANNSCQFEVGFMIYIILTKNYSFQTYKDVCDLYGIVCRHKVEVDFSPPFLPFLDIRPLPTNSYPDPGSNSQNEIYDELVERTGPCYRMMIKSNGHVNSRALVVYSFVSRAAWIFNPNLYVSEQGHLSGRKFDGPIHFWIYSGKHRRILNGVAHHCTLGGVTVVGGGNADFEQGIAQNIAQLESALKGGDSDRGLVQDDFTQLRKVDHFQRQRQGKRKTYGVVTDSETWAFLECTLDKGKVKVSIRMSMLEEKVDCQNLAGKDGVISAFGKLAWLFSLMRNESLAREVQGPGESAPLLPRPK